MLKKYILIHDADGDVIDVCEVKECEPLKFLKLKKQADETRARKGAQKEIRIKKIEEDIKILKGED